MKITIITIGTRGDIQPYIALGVGLKKAGYDIILATCENFRHFVEDFELKFHPVRVDFSEIMRSQGGQKMLEADTPLKFLTSHHHIDYDTMNRKIGDDIWDACKGCDAIIYHPGIANAFLIAQELGVPSIMASPIPMSSTKDYPSLLLYDGPRLGKLYNLLTHFIFEQGFWMMFRSGAKKFWKSRKKSVPFITPNRLQRDKGLPILYGYSEHMLRRPYDWEDNIQITGNWLIHAENDWTPPDNLKEFLLKGSAPVYIGFGSIYQSDEEAKQTTEIISEALQISGQRGIIATGWNGLSRKIDLPESILTIESAPHTWLFPKMAAVVHHGGVGTTSAGLYAGVPSIIIPHCNDQPAWGRRIYELGVGPKSIPRKKLTAKKLADAIKAALSEDIRKRAREIGNNMQKEDGVNKAVGIINKYFKAV